MRFVAVCLLLFSFVACVDTPSFAKSEVQAMNLTS